MSSGNLPGQLVSRDFWPSCTTCAFFAACATRPQHPAYLHAWHWGQEFVSFPDGDLILTSWVGSTVIGQRHTGYTQYVVTPAYVSEPRPHQRRYLALAHERTELEQQLVWLERHRGFCGEAETLYQRRFSRFLAVLAEQRALRQAPDAVACAA